MIRWATMLRRTFGEYHGHAPNEASVGRCIPRGGERHEPFGDSLPPSPFPRPGDTASYHRYQRRFGMNTRGEGVWGKPDGWNWRGQPGPEDRGPRDKDRGTDAPASRLVSRRPGTRYAAHLARPSGAVLTPRGVESGVQSPESRQAERPAARRGRSSPPVPRRSALGGDIHHELTSRPRGDIVCLVEAWPERSDHSGGTGTEDEDKFEKREPTARDRIWELEMPFLSSIDAAETDEGRRRVARERMERDRT